MEDLPIVPEFVAAGFIIRDMRTVGKRDRAQALAFQSRVVSSMDYPTDLFCDCGMVRREDARRAFRDAAREGGTIDGRPPPALLADKIEQFKQMAQVRHTETIFGGDFKPLTFVLYIDEEVVGAFQWYGVREVSQPDRTRLAVRAGFFPALGLDEDEVNANCLQIVREFLVSDIPMIDGRVFDLVQAVAPTISERRPDTRGHRKSMKLYKRAAIAGDLSVSFQSDPTQPGRGRIRVTAPGRPPIREPEIDALVFERSGKELTDSDGPVLADVR